MNVAIQSTTSDTALQPADPLDHLAAVLFHSMGSHGVYARTGFVP
jgi:hypothetical protein